MTESSGPWDGSSFAEDEWRALFRSKTNGRLKSGNDDCLEITRSASDREVTVGAGQAILQGMLYQNTADVVFDVPVPSGSNLRTDYVALRYDPTESLADRIVLALIEGAEAVSPIPPALVQNETGTWEHPLAIVGPYATGVISAAPFALLSPVSSRRFYVPIGSYADPNAMPGLVANFRDEAFDDQGRVWQLNASSVWELKNAGLGTPVQNETSSAITTSTVWPTYSANSVLGVAFVAPPSGRVYITVSGGISSSVNGRKGVLSYEVRTGATISAGAVVLAASDDRAVQNSQAVTAGGPSFINASHRRMLTGLTPGSSYNARCMQAHVAGAVTMGYRGILVEPAS